MRSVPDRPPATALGARVPACEDFRTWRPAPALEEGVEDPQRPQHQQRRTEAEEDIEYAGHNQAQPHKIARVGTIADHA
ncbi:hypothetical protein D3C73_1222110 [compost metagenome]